MRRRRSRSPRAVSTVVGEVLKCQEWGVRVRRGPDWNKRDQDGGGLGTSMGASSAGPGWVKVRWDSSKKCHRYRVGADGKYDLIVADSSMPETASISEDEVVEQLDPDAGHDECWLDPQEASGLQCTICLCVARDAMAHDCGNLFCEICWTRWFTKNHTCPVCRDDGNSIVRAPRDQRKILNLLVVCPFSCGEHVRLGDKEQHVSQCPRRRLRCNYCGIRMKADMLVIHQQDQMSDWQTTRAATCC